MLNFKCTQQGVPKSDLYISVHQTLKRITCDTCSPRLLKYGSTSSVESSPHTGGGRTGSERGSIESLTRSDSLARSESDVTRDSPRPRTKSRDTEEEDEDEEEEPSMEEKR